MAASSTSAQLSLSSTIITRKAPLPSQLASSPQCVSLPTLPLPPQSRTSTWKTSTTGYCRKLARNVVAMATGEAPATDVPATDPAELIKPLQEAWDKVEDKYAVSSLAVAGVVALWGSAGLISAIDRLPLIPGVLELVGIGYTGWFAYKNLVFQPDREALLAKVKSAYNDIIGSS